MNRQLCVLLFFVFSCSAWSATLPEGFSETILATSLSNPVSMAFAPDGRIFICEQGGRLKVWKNGSILPTPFVTLNVDSNGDRGLLAVAVDPNFTQNSYVYLLYTLPGTPAHNVVSRFTANGDIAQSGSETRIFNISNLSDSLHHCDNSMAFGPDGRLYIGVADNSDGTNAQSMSTLLGKMLRINSDGTIPEDNPFYNTAEGDNRAIWAYGLRNPFSFSFNRVSGRMLIDDVGLSTWEEINEGTAGANYGWPTTEGATTDDGITGPIFSYGHGTTATTGCAITGGAFYTPSTQQFPAAYVGRYFFTDYCGSWLRMLDFSNNTVTATPFGTGLGQYPVGLKVGPDGSLYYLSRGANAFKGSLRRIQYSPAVVPTIAQQPSSQTIFIGDSATFFVSVSGAFPMTYQWQRNGQPIAGATASSYTLTNAQLSDSGATFNCVITNGYGSATTSNATLTVIQDQVPMVTMTSPSEGTLYTAGMTVDYSATATDPEDGAVPAASFMWQIEQVRPSHARPLVQPIIGQTNGSIQLPDIGQADADVSYRFTCTVHDSRGEETSVVRELFPKLVQLTLRSDVPGLELSLDAHPGTTEIDSTGVVGFIRHIGTTTPRRLDGSVYDFEGWSDGGEIVHDITTPDGDGVWTAHFGRRDAPLVAGIALENAGELETGDTLRFSAALSLNPHSTMYTWLWDFGDGAQSTDAEAVTHVYSQPGNYVLTLTVTDDMGLQTVIATTVTVISSDLDGDGIPNRVDPDNDNDGFSDVVELAMGSDPRDPNSVPVQPAKPARLRKLNGAASSAGTKPDSIAFQMLLPANIAPGDQISVSIGNAITTFSKARSSWSSPAGKITLLRSARNPDLLLSAKLRSPGLCASLQPESGKQSFPIRVMIAGETYECAPHVICFERNGALKLSYSAGR